MALSWYNGFSPRDRDDSFKWQTAQIASGAVPPATKCDACGETEGLIGYHAEDYSRPFGPHLQAHQLCFRCHMALHRRHSSPARWQRYIEQLDAGAVFVPLRSMREFGTVWAEPVTSGPPRARLEFFRSLLMSKSVTAKPDAATISPPLELG
jgi:hypothetical protein